MMSLTIAIIGAVLVVLGAAWINLINTPNGSQVGVVIGTPGAVLTTAALIARGIP
jgi:hypothetical protein